LKFLFPSLEEDPGWRARYAATLRRVDPSPADLDETRRQATLSPSRATPSQIIFDGLTTTS
jgi:hypothetical protein